MFEKIIKIRGKRTFSDLSHLEVVYMIEADSSISPSGNKYFSSCALDEFLHCSVLTDRPDLEKIKSDILKSIYIDSEGAKEKIINTIFLKNIV